MAPIAGKYEHTKNENIKEFILGVGLCMANLLKEFRKPDEFSNRGQGEDLATKAEGIKATMEVAQNGNEFTIKTSYASKETTIVFTLNKEFDDPMPNGLVLKSTASLDGNKILVKSKKDGSEIGSRTYIFSDNELIIEMTSILTKVVGKRFYKRV